MADTSWNNGTPAAGDLVSEGDDRMKEDRKNTFDRLVQGSHYMTTPDQVLSNSQNDDGKHVTAYTDTNGHVRPGFAVYKGGDPTTKVVDVTDTGMAVTGTITGTNVSTGTDPGHAHTGSLMIRFPGSVIAGTQNATIRLPRDFTITRVGYTIKDPPTSSFTVQLYATTASKLATPAFVRFPASPYPTSYPDQVLNSGLTVASGVAYSGETTSFKGATSSYLLTANYEMIIYLSGVVTPATELNIIIEGYKV